MYACKRVSRIAQFFLVCGLLVTTVTILVPFSPGMLPTNGLDPSWVMGLQQAIVQGLTFGREIIFTYGPYAPVYTGSYHPSTDVFFSFVCLYLAISYWACLIFVLRNAPWYWVLAFFIVLTMLIHARETLFLLFPLLTGLLILKIQFAKDEKSIKNKLALFSLALAFSAFGLLVLVKGTLLVPCVTVIFLYTIFFSSKDHISLTMLYLLLPIASLLFFWIIADLPIAALSNYFIGLAYIISGYTEAMALNGSTFEILMYLTASILILLIISFQMQLIGKEKLFLLCIYCLFLFLSFKVSFVRHDVHALIAATSLLVAALLLPFAFKSWALFPAIIFVLLTSIYIKSNYINNPVYHDIKQISAPYASAWYGIQNRLENKKWPKSAFDAGMNALRVQASFPLLSGTTDIYSYGQGGLIASGNIWSPRPIFQSYSVYTPELANRNRRHLLGDRAPDHIIFKIEPIDERLPALEDGASWPVLLTHYQLVQRKTGFLLLQKRIDMPNFEEPSILAVYKYDFGKLVNLPEFSENLIYAQIEIQPTILGRIASLLFKTSQLQITLNLKNGITKRYRFIANMAKSGFLISPLIDTTDEFGMLYGNKGLFLDSKMVASIMITSRHSGYKLWKDRYTITFSQIQTGPKVGLSEIYKFETFDNVSIGAPAEKCDGFIDIINGMPSSTMTLSVSNYLQVQGWLVESVANSVLAESTYVVLTDLQNQHKSLHTHVMSRPDVGAHFNKPELSQSGYRTRADISMMKEGDYILGLAIKQSGEIKRCPQFNFPITITRKK